jgi:L-threonylcarbamoyladenylate synthase
MKAIIGQSIQDAAHYLRQQELVAIPTETVYGLAANALDAVAVSKIFDAKNRPYFDPLIVHVGRNSVLTDYVTHVPPLAQALIDAFWPGPLTLVLPKRDCIPDLVCSGLDTVGIRMPKHPLTLELLDSLSFPLAAPSANPFGYISPTTAYHVQDQLGDRIPYILDGGPCRVGVESTIVSFENDRLKILRFGGLSQEAIEDVVGRVEISTYSASNPTAPGMLFSHYAPRKKMKEGPVDHFISNARVGTMRFKGISDQEKNKVLSPSGNLLEAAQQLFCLMRQLDQLDIDEIVFEFVPHEGIGRAINDRLSRATHP